MLRADLVAVLVLHGVEVHNDCTGISEVIHRRIAPVVVLVEESE